MTTSFDIANGAYAVAIQPDDKLVAAGYADSYEYRDGGFAYTNGSDFALARYEATSVPINAAPVARDDSHEADGGRAIRIPVKRGVLDNDKDADNDELSAEVVEEPKRGKLTLNENGSFTYNPNCGFSGKDTFTYKVTDGAADSNAATVTINIPCVDPRGPGDSDPSL